MSLQRLAADLIKTVEECDLVVEAVKAEWEKNARWHEPGETVYGLRDSTGRPVLLDLLAGRAQGLAALAYLGATGYGEPPPAEPTS